MKPLENFKLFIAELIYHINIEYLLRMETYLAGHQNFYHFGMQDEKFVQYSDILEYTKKELDEKIVKHLKTG